MGGKKGVESSKDRSAAKAKDKANAAAKAAEDAEWAAAGEGAKSKAQKKKDAQASERADAAARKKEAKALAEEEDMDLAEYGKKTPKKTPSKKMTAAERAAVQDGMRKKQEEEQRQKQKDARRERSASDYERMVDIENTNRDLDTLDASGLDNAIAAMDSLTTDQSSSLPPDRKAEYERFRSMRLPEMKQEKPGLKSSQYQDMLWKEWQKEYKKIMQK